MTVEKRQNCTLYQACFSKNSVVYAIITKNTTHSPLTNTV